MSSMDARPLSTAIIGDSVSDVDAAKAIPIAVIGYANAPEKADTLSEADALVATIGELAYAMAITLPSA